MSRLVKKLHQNFDKKIFLLKMLKNKFVSILMHFLDKTAHLFLLKIEVFRSESVKRVYRLLMSETNIMIIWIISDNLIH